MFGRMTINKQYKPTCLINENINILSDIETELNDIDDIQTKSVNNKILDPRAKMK